MFRYTQSLILLTMILTAFLVAPITIEHAYADETWQDTLSFTPFSTTIQENIRNITNTASFPLKITVTYVNAENISRIKLYRLSANNTIFVQIIDGAVVEYSDSYEPLDIGKILVFTVYARPSDTIAQNETASVRVRVLAESVETGGGPWRPLVTTEDIECTLNTSPNVQLSIPQLIANRLPVHYVISINNKCPLLLNVTVRAWVTDLLNYRIVYYSLNQSLLIPDGELIIGTFDISMPIADSIFDVLGHLQNPYVLHVSFDYEISKKQRTTEELLATINVDSSNAVIQLIIIVGCIVALLLVMYFGLFKRRKKIKEEISKIPTLQ